MEPQLEVEISRNVKVKTYPFTDYFRGFEKIEVVKRVFGDKTEEVLRTLQVEFVGSRWSYMGVSDIDGHLIVGANYLKKGDIIDIYLDVVHELVHVKQFMDGKKLFERHYNYVDRPTEVEAYSLAVEEARRLGLTDKRILEYLETEWMTDEELKRLASTLKVKCDGR